MFYSYQYYHGILSNYSDCKYKTLYIKHCKSWDSNRILPIYQLVQDFETIPSSAEMSESPWLTWLLVQLCNDSWFKLSAFKFPLDVSTWYVLLGFLRYQGDVMRINFQNSRCGVEFRVAPAAFSKIIGWFTPQNRGIYFQQKHAECRYGTVSCKIYCR